MPRRSEEMLREFNQQLEQEVELRTQALQQALDQLTVEVRSAAEQRNNCATLRRWTPSASLPAASHTTSTTC